MTAIPIIFLAESKLILSDNSRFIKKTVRSFIEERWERFRMAKSSST